MKYTDAEGDILEINPLGGDGSLIATIVEGSKRAQVIILPHHVRELWVRLSALVDECQERASLLSFED